MCVCARALGGMLEGRLGLRCEQVQQGESRQASPCSYYVSLACG